MILGLDTSNALEYYHLSGKFNLPGLKQEILDFMKTDVTIDNFYIYFEFSEKNDLEDLKYNVAKYIEANLSEVIKKEDWNKLDPGLRWRLVHLENRENHPEVHEETVFSRMSAKFTSIIRSICLFYYDPYEWGIQNQASLYLNVYAKTPF